MVKKKQKTKTLGPYMWDRQTEKQKKTKGTKRAKLLCMTYMTYMTNVTYIYDICHTYVWHVMYDVRYGLQLKKKLGVIIF